MGVEMLIGRMMIHLQKQHPRRFAGFIIIVIPRFTLQFNSTAIDWLLQSGVVLHTPQLRRIPNIDSGIKLKVPCFIPAVPWPSLHVSGVELAVRKIYVRNSRPSMSKVTYSFGFHGSFHRQHRHFGEYWDSGF